MKRNYLKKLVAVFGQPVAENPTCVMQEAAFAALGLDWRYFNVEVSPERLADAVLGARAWGLEGFNLTIPHKVAVMQHLDEIAHDAQVIGAVNTVRRVGDRLIGENTDGKGFIRGMRSDAGVDPAGQRVVILGAGGAARAIATELALASAQDIVVVNRTPDRGETMVAHLHQQTGANIRFERWQGTYRVPSNIDIFVNATSIGLYPNIAMPDIDLSQVRQGALVCDVVFNPPQTPLLEAAASRGLRVLDGLSMLVYQGAIGFEMWTGMQAPEAVMKDALRKALGI
ncbi:MAG: shikimate dehydrogenase [Aggregatilineales bacterium]